MPENHIVPHPAPSLSAKNPEHSELAGLSSDETAAPSARLGALVDRARAYVEASSSANTRRAYASDWKHFASWCRRQGLSPLPPDPQTVGLYITALAAGESAPRARPSSVATVERRLSAICWNYTQRGLLLDRKDRHIATILGPVGPKLRFWPTQRTDGERAITLKLTANLDLPKRGRWSSWKH